MNVLGHPGPPRRLSQARIHAVGRCTAICCRRSTETCLQVPLAWTRPHPDHFPWQTHFGPPAGFGRAPAAASMSEAFSPGFSNTPCWAWELSIRAGAGGPSVFVPTGPGPGDDPVTAAPGATCPAPWAGRGSVAKGEVWVDGCCARAGQHRRRSRQLVMRPRPRKATTDLSWCSSIQPSATCTRRSVFVLFRETKAMARAGDQISRLPI